jgi:hypothetical protein
MVKMGLISGKSTGVLWKSVWNILDGRFKLLPVKLKLALGMVRVA